MAVYAVRSAGRSIGLQNDPSKLYVGRAKAWINLEDQTGTLPAGTPTGMRDVGNLTYIAFQSKDERLPHWNTRQAQKLNDKNVVVSADCTATFGLDEQNAENLAMALKGLISTQTITTSPTWGASSVVNFKVNDLDSWYPLYRGVGAIAVGDGSIGDVYGGNVGTSDIATLGVLPAAYVDPSSVIVTNSTATVTYVLNTDYRVNGTFGRIFIVNRYGAANSIPANSVIRVNYTATGANGSAIGAGNPQAHTYIDLQRQLLFRGALTVQGINAYNGKTVLVEIPRGTFTIQGSLGLFDKKWNEAKFTFTSEFAGDLNPTYPFGRILELPS